MAPPAVHRAAADGDLTIVDIRRPAEWRRTGIPAHSVPLDMRRDDFVARLTEIVEGELGAPLAIICARGVRSSRMSAHLAEAGFENVINVPEGMLGSAAGPGWIARDLPTRRP